MLVPLLSGLSAAAISMPRTSSGTEANVTSGAPEYMGAGAFSADFAPFNDRRSLPVRACHPLSLMTYVQVFGINYTGSWLS